ncbi:hypothetical protein Pve01_83300 [Planomonospora venezuelensis]|nr:hypothetical protein Pve01_83300 [Planomonospora venezuelensis]
MTDVAANEGAQHRVRAKVGCRNGHQHDLCILIRREVHPDLRCQPEQGAGYAMGGGGCVLPPDLDVLAERELREHYQESRRRGWVEIAAA